MRAWAPFVRGFAGNVRFSAISIVEQKLRSTLTVLGIVVGVTTVMAMVAIVTGFNNNIIGNLQTFGANRIEVRKYEDRFGPGGPLSDEERRRKNLTIEDAVALRALLPDAAVGILYVQVEALLHIKNGNLEANAPYIVGTDEFYPTTTAQSLGRGRCFTPTEVQHHALVAVLGGGRAGGALPQGRSHREGHHGRGPALPRDRRAGEKGGAVRLLARQQGGRALRGIRAAVRLPRAKGRRGDQHRAPADGGHAGGAREGGGRP